MIRIFISSVQVEFASLRRALHDYLLSDPLLGKFFEPFLFELLPSMDERVERVFLREVEHSDIYLGILGKDYGFEDMEGVSPTEREFDHATAHHKTRLIFLTNHASNERQPKQKAFVEKAGAALVRRRFGTIDELKAAVYAALVRYLEEKEIIRTGPFDASFARDAGLDLLDGAKVRRFVSTARAKRGFRLVESAPMQDVLTHLNLIDDGRVTNAAILLFGRQPQ